MVSFYNYVFNNFPDMMLHAINNLINKKYLFTSTIGSYNSLPQKDYEFRKMVVNLKLKDIIYD